MNRYNRYIPALDPIPSGLAYYDGERYRCYGHRCMIVDADVEECGRLPHIDDSYTPILRCQCCGTLYFGIATYEPEDETPPPPAPAKKPEPPQPQRQDEGIILPNLLTV